MNVKIFERFRAACDEFFKRKAEFFKSIKESMAGNLEKKKALCEKAEALKESTDWKATADILSKLQKEWKTIGPVPKKYSDAVWKRFIAACDYFFEQKNNDERLFGDAVGVEPLSHAAYAVAAHLGLVFLKIRSRKK